MALLGNIGGTLKKKGLVHAMTGKQPAFSTPPQVQQTLQALGAPQDQQMMQTPQFSLPENYGFGDLASYEEARRGAAGQSFQNQIGSLQTGIQGQYDQALKDYQTSTAQKRTALSSSLSDTAQKNFQLQNPKILEDLNSRGLFNSGTAVANAQAQALKELEVQNQGELNKFDNTSRTYEDQLANQRLSDLNNLKSMGVSSNLQAQQDALDSGLDLRRGGLEAQRQDSNASREEQMARDLADQQRKAGITNSLIGVGGSLLGGALSSGGGIGGLFGSLGGGGALGGAATGQVVPGLGAVGTGASGAGALGAIGTGGAIAAAGLGSMAIDKKVGPIVNNLVANKLGLGNSAGSAARYLYNPIGAPLNKVKELVKDPGKTIEKSVASPVKSVAKSVSSAVSSVFCFDAHTLISMADGRECPINHLEIGDETKGGEVVSIRKSKTAAGTRCLYKGIVVTGSHAVKENGKWIRVKDSDHAAPLEGGGIVWSIVTDKHRVWIQGIEMADEHETDNYEQLTIEQSLEQLNREEKNIMVEA